MVKANPLLEAALSYAILGWPVLPLHWPKDGACSCGDPACSAPAKHPLTERGSHDATTDLRTIKRWWRRRPEANIGIVMGGGCVALDIDPRHGGDESLRDLGELPDTVTAATGGGGQHLLYKTDAPVRTRKGIRPGIDVIGEGYIVGPTSCHISGRRYEWTAGHAPGQIAFASFPSALAALVPEDRAPAEPLPDRIPAGQRDDTLTSLAGSMRRRGASAEAIEAALVVENDTRCDPPLGPADVRRISQSVGRYAVPEAPMPALQAVGPGARVLRPKQAPDAPQAEPIKEARGGWDIRQFTRWAQEDEVGWLVEGLWVDCAVGLCIGAQGSYKGWLTADLAVSVASGLPFLGAFPVHRQGPVVVIQQEDRPGETSERLARIYYSKSGSYIHQVDSQHLSCRLPSPPACDLPVYVLPWGFSVRQKDWPQKLEDILRRIRPALVIIDPLYAVGLDLKVWFAEVATELMPVLKRLRELYNTAFIVVHHVSKADLKSMSIDRPRMGGLGSVLIGASSDAAWFSVRKCKEEAITLGFEDKTKGPMPPKRVEFTIDREAGIYRTDIKDAGWTQDDTLDAIEVREGMTISELIEVTGRPRRTIYRHIEDLKEGGFVEERKKKLYIAAGTQGRLPEDTDDDEM